MTPVLIDHLARQPSRSQIGRISAGTESPEDAARRFRDITRVTGLAIHVADVLDLDVGSAEAAAADIGIALDQVGAGVLILDPVDVLPIEERTLAFALRRMALTRDLAIVLAGGPKRYSRRAGDLKLFQYIRIFIRRIRVLTRVPAFLYAHCRNLTCSGNLRQNTPDEEFATKTKLATGRIMFTLQELVRATGLSLRTLQREVDDGHLVAVMVRGRVMVRAEAAEKWIESRERAGK